MSPSIQELYETTFYLKHYLNFSVDEINSMTVHEKKVYLSKFRDIKLKEQEIINNVKNNKNNIVNKRIISPYKSKRR